MKSLRGADDLADFILQNYPGKVVEVGAGFVADVALRLTPLRPVITDREKRDLGGISVQADDIFSPSLEIYRGASLIYSLRPPLEVQLAIGDVARKVGADLLVRPLGDEIAELKGFSRKLVNAGEARFYLFKLTALTPSTGAENYL